MSEHYKLHHVLSGETVGVSDFVRRQTPDSGLSYFLPDYSGASAAMATPVYQDYDECLVGKVCEHFHEAKPGYRDGVILVPVNPNSFRTGVVCLIEGDKLVGEFKPRQPGEEPRKQTRVVQRVVNGEPVPPLPAKQVDIVLYRLDVLKENDEQTPGLDADWEIISINASPLEGEMPISTGALIANHLGLSGGTDTKMTDEEFVKTLRESVEFWKDKALLAPKED